MFDGKEDSRNDSDEARKSAVSDYHVMIISHLSSENFVVKLIPKSNGAV